jgi:hypothetical protein
MGLRIFPLDWFEGNLCPILFPLGYLFWPHGNSIGWSFEKLGENI